MLNAQPIGGKKGTRWRDDIWTMKYLPKFKWNMLTEQVGASLSIVYPREDCLLNVIFCSQRSGCTYGQTAG